MVKAKKPKKEITPPVQIEETAEERELYADDELLAEEDSDTIAAKMEHGEKDEDIEKKEGREKLEEDDEIDPWEEGFMDGASGPGQLAKDALTGEPLMGIEDVIEVEINGELYRFVNEENAEKFMEKRRKEKGKRY